MKRPKNIVVKQSIIPELVSGSSTQSVTKQQALKTLKKFQGLFYFTTARGLTRGRHPELVSGSSRSIKGFTLIELLVVVLIIGILAAVAVPQYQRAVEKSRMTEAFSVLRSLSIAAQTYYLEHGTYTGISLEKLPIHIDANKIKNYELLFGDTRVFEEGTILSISMLRKPDGYYYMLAEQTKGKEIYYYCVTADDRAINMCRLIAKDPATCNWPPRQYCRI